MPKYTVHAQITICQELTIEADSPEEAEEEFKKQCDEIYGWSDMDTVNVEEK